MRTETNSGNGRVARIVLSAAAKHLSPVTTEVSSFSLKYEQSLNIFDSSEVSQYLNKVSCAVP